MTMHPREQSLILFKEYGFCAGDEVEIFTWEADCSVPPGPISPMTTAVCKYFRDGIGNVGHLLVTMPSAFSDNQLRIEVNKRVVNSLRELLSEPFIEIRIVREEDVDGEEDPADLLILERRIPLQDMINPVRTEEPDEGDSYTTIIPFVNELDDVISLLCRVTLGWREPPKMVQMCTKSFMENLFEDEPSKDLTILAGNGAEIKCHALIFASHTPAFSAMLSPKSGMKEARSKKVEMSENSEEGINHIVRYLYGLELAIGDMTCDIALELFETAHKYGLSQLEGSLMELFLEQNMKWFTLDVVLEMYFFVRNLDVMEKLREHALCLMSSVPTAELRICDVFKKLDREEAVDVSLKLVDYVCQKTKNIKLN